MNKSSLIPGKFCQQKKMFFNVSKQFRKKNRIREHDDEIEDNNGKAVAMSSQYWCIRLRRKETSIRTKERKQKHDGRW